MYPGPEIAVDERALLHSKDAAKPALNDVGIIDAVEDRFLMNTGAPAYAIDVETRQGIVALGGTVANILASEGAVAITETVKV
jgi:osmotically-inducible protein OsmY